MGYLGYGEFWYTFWGPFSHTKWQYIPLALAAYCTQKSGQKAVKISLLNADNDVCTCLNGIEWKCTQKSVHKWVQKAKMGGRGMGMGWIIQGLGDCSK